MKQIICAVLPILLLAAQPLLAEQPKTEPQTKRSQSELPASRTFKVKDAEFTVRLIPAGTFTMGAPVTEDGREDDETPHQVTISKPFYMMETEVTVELYQAVAGSLPAGMNENRKNVPVTMVTWARANDFCKQLSAVTGVEFRLPTEAEWEYACRAGTQTPYYWGTQMNGDYAWYFGNAQKTAQPVKQKKPNAFGLYDMSGNVWEWVADMYMEYPTQPVVDPQFDDLKDKNGPVFRGGGFGQAFGEKDDPRYLRAAERNMTSGPSKDIGFRACFTVKP